MKRNRFKSLKIGETFYKNIVKINSNVFGIFCFQKMFNEILKIRNVLS